MHEEPAAEIHPEEAAAVVDLHALVETEPAEQVLLLQLRGLRSSCQLNIFQGLAMQLPWAHTHLKISS